MVVVWRRVLVSSVVTGLLLMAFAAEALASDPEPGSDVATRLQECEGIFVWGQVWLDTDGDARLTEDAGVDAVVVRVEQSGGTTPTVTDDDGVPLLPILIGVAVSGAGIAAALVLRGRGAVPANGGASSGPPGLTDPNESDDSDDDKRGTIVGGKD